MDDRKSNGQQPPRPNPSAPQRLGWPRGTGEMFRTWIREHIIAPRVRVWQQYQEDIAARRSRRERRRLREANQAAYDSATTCLCGRPAVVRTRSPFSTAYRPWFALCEEHRGVPLDQPWERLADGAWSPIPDSQFHRYRPDGSRGEPVYGVDEEEL